MKTTIRLFICMLLILQPCLSHAQPVINGAGATFPGPLYIKWIEEYGKSRPLRVTYRETGSSDGIRMLLAREVDFGATDAYLPDETLKQHQGSLLHIPTCIGAVAIIYHLEGSPEIKMTPAVLADIFMGKITSWSDKRIREINPGIDIRENNITLVHRSEGSGTTFLLAHYLSQVSVVWEKKIGSGQAIRWPTGIGVRENSGIAAMVKKIPGSVGYVSLNHAIKNGLATVALQNASGNFIKPTVAAVTAAASVVLPTDARIMLTNSPTPSAYPICGFSYIIVYREQSYRDHSEERSRALAKFLLWCIRDGQRYTEKLFYAPLPDQTMNQLEKAVRTMTFKGKPLL